MQEEPTHDINTLSQVVAIGTVIVYVLGFIVVNARLAHWHTTSFDLANPQYLSAGLMVAASIGIFWFMVWRRLLHFSGDIRELSEKESHLRWPRAWFLFSRLVITVDLLFGAVVGVFWSAGLLFNITEQQKLFVAVLTAAFILDYFIRVRGNIYAERPFLAVPLAFISRLMVLSLLPRLISDSINSLFLINFILVFALIVVRDVNSRMRMPLPFMYFWIMTFLVGIAATFGALCFPYVKSSIGGGEPHNVEVYFAESAPSQLLDSLGATAGAPARIVQLAETSSYVILAKDLDPENAVRVSKEAIIALRTWQKDRKVRLRNGPTVAT